MPDASPAIALGITAAVVVVAGRVVGAVRSATVPSVLVGRDGRTSTTTTVASAWTVLLLWFTVALAFRPSASWARAFGGIDAATAALVAAPFLTAVLCRAVVGARVARGGLQKPPATGPTWTDIVSNDDGGADLIDLQYLLFNAAGVALIVVRYLTGTETPPPAALVAVTAVPGAVLVVSKALIGNRPVLTSVTPLVVHPGERFTVFGRNLLAATSGADARLSATVDGLDALVVLASDTSVVVLTPQVDGPVSVRVVTTDGAVAVLPHPLTVLPAQPSPRR